MEDRKFRGWGKDWKMGGYEARKPGGKDESLHILDMDYYYHDGEKKSIGNSELLGRQRVTIIVHWHAK